LSISKECRWCPSRVNEEQAVNPLDATSIPATTGLIGVFWVLVAETGLLAVGVSEPAAGERG